MKIYQFITLTAAILLVGLFGSGARHASSFVEGASAAKPTFSATGTVNTSSTVNTTSTQVIGATWNNLLRISNNATATINCYADNQTAASSSVASLSGVVISSNALPGNIVSFGPLGDIPYVGAVNCIASFKTSVGILAN